MGDFFMNMLRVIEKRKSIRDYREKKLESKDKVVVTEILNSLPEIVVNQGIEIQFFEDGKNVYDLLNGYAGYNGIMVKSPHYIVLLGQNSYQSDLLAGYVGEWAILKLTKSNIGTCWVDIGNNGQEIKEKLQISSTKDVLGIISLGYADFDIRMSSTIESTVDKTVSPITKLGYPGMNLSYKEDNTSARKAIEDFVFIKKWGNKVDSEELKKMGFDEVIHYMRLAPSWGNRQPWMFILDGSKVIITIEKSEDVSLHDQYIEAGIGMLYFEVAMHGLGLPGQWEINCQELKSYEIPEEYFIAGYYGY